MRPPRSSSGRRTERPPAYLAWTPGGLPVGFRARVRTIRGLEATVVFAGDTLWLTGSRDASGDVVDDPRPPYAFPIDAFAVDPDEVAPFLPERGPARGGRHPRARQGRARHPQRRAPPARRRRHVLEFGEREVRVGAVVPDELIGWSEVLVSRDAGASARHRPRPVPAGRCPRGSRQPARVRAHAAPARAVDAADAGRAPRRHRRTCGSPTASTPRSC